MTPNNLLVLRRAVAVGAGFDPIIRIFDGADAFNPSSSTSSDFFEIETQRDMLGQFHPLEYKLYSTSTSVLVAAHALATSWKWRLKVAGEDVSDYDFTVFYSGLGYSLNNTFSASEIAEKIDGHNIDAYLDALVRADNQEHVNAAYYKRQSPKWHVQKFYRLLQQETTDKLSIFQSPMDYLIRHKNIALIESFLSEDSKNAVYALLNIERDQQ